MYDVREKIYSAALGFTAGLCIGNYFDRNDKDGKKFDWKELQEDEKDLFGYLPCGNMKELMEYYCLTNKRLNPDDFAKYLMMLSEQNRIDDCLQVSVRES